VADRGLDALLVLGCVLAVAATMAPAPVRDDEEDAGRGLPEADGQPLG